jgi:hypothetical protein
MDFEAPQGNETERHSDEGQARRRMLRALFYLSSGTIILAALLVALFSASSPPPDDARIVVTDTSGTRIPSDDTIKALRQACAEERIEAPSWHWSPFRWSEIGLRCVVRNRDTNLPSTVVWQFDASPLIEIPESRTSELPAASVPSIACRTATKK